MTDSPTQQLSLVELKSYKMSSQQTFSFGIEMEKVQL